MSRLLNLALFGAGRMGRIVADHAAAEGHALVAVIDSSSASRSASAVARLLSSADVAIDFSVADAVVRNVEACGIAAVPVVVGVTGWNQEASTVRSLIEMRGAGLVHGSNFSIGANVFARVVSRAAELFALVDGYEAFVEESHHSRKRDAPSGTALALSEVVASRIGKVPSIASTRAGSIPGTHRIGFDGPADQVLLTHEARSRDGFAAGALFAARWIVSRRGHYSFDEVIQSVLQDRRYVS